MAFYSTGTTKAKERRKQRAKEHDRAVINAFYTDDSGQFPRTVPLKQIRWLSGFVGWLQTRSAKRQRFDWCRSIGFTDVETGHRVVVGDRTLRIGGDVTIYSEIRTYRMLDVLTTLVPAIFEGERVIAPPQQESPGGNWYLCLRSETEWSRLTNNANLRRYDEQILKHTSEDEVLGWLSRQWTLPEGFVVKHSRTGVILSSLPDGSIARVAADATVSFHTREQLDARFGPRSPCPSYLQPETEEVA